MIMASKSDRFSAKSITPSGQKMTRGWNQGIYLNIQMSTVLATEISLTCTFNALNDMGKKFCTDQKRYNNSKQY